MDKILLALAEMKAEMEAFFSGKPAAADENLTSLQAQLESARSDLAAANATLASRDTSLAALTTDLADLATANVASLASFASLTTQLATETKRTDETLAALGIDPKLIPASMTPPAAGAGPAILAQFEKINDATERVVFYRKHKAAIDDCYKR